jgi:ketosteroid isomerase-like protein
VLTVLERLEQTVNGKDSHKEEWKNAWFTNIHHPQDHEVEEVYSSEPPHLVFVHSLKHIKHWI